MSFLAGPNGYTAVDSALKSRLGVQNVVIHGYPDIVHAANGAVCLTDCSPDGSINTISPSDMTFAAELQGRLNAAVQAGAGLPGWRYADIAAATRNHGICVCGDMYYNTWTAATGLRLGAMKNGVGVELLPSSLRSPCSLGNQSLCLRNLNGPDGGSCSFHPSERGYREYVEPILGQLNLLFPD